MTVTETTQVPQEASSPSPPPLRSFVFLQPVKPLCAQKPCLTAITFSTVYPASYHSEPGPSTSIPFFHLCSLCGSGPASFHGTWGLVLSPGLCHRLFQAKVASFTGRFLLLASPHADSQSLQEISDSWSQQVSIQQAISAVLTFVTFRMAKSAMSSRSTGQKTNYRSQGLSLIFQSFVSGGDRGYEVTSFLGSFHFLETIGRKGRGF